MTPHLIEVVMCTHNPRLNCLQRTLDGLKTQTLPKEQWRLLIVDNQSDPAVAGRIDLSWHPAASVIREEELGLTAARLRGIREAASELLVFVDDDNELERGYLSAALKIARDHPNIGAFGGNIAPEFESAPDPSTKPLWPSLALRTVVKDAWANFPLPLGPCGAGLCVRQKVAASYARALEKSPLRKMLDRKGASLASGGDDDLVMTAHDMGLGAGLFATLKVTHLIPRERSSETYLLRLEENIVYSGTLLSFARGGNPHRRAADPRTFRRRVFSSLWSAMERMFSGQMRRRQLAAHARGRARALQEIAALEEPGQSPAGK